jgi:hypothetical protein
MLSQTPNHRRLHFPIVRFVEPDHVLRDFVHELSATSAGFSGRDELVTEAAKEPFEIAISKGSSTPFQRLPELFELRHRREFTTVWRFLQLKNSCNPEREEAEPWGHGLGGEVARTE